MKQTKSQIFQPIAALMCVSLLVACEGESRPFQEAVEIESLALASLQILPPTNSQATIYVNHGQQLQLGISGTNSTGEHITLGSSDRSWSSTDSNVISIDKDGLITGVTDGTANVHLNIGGIEAAGFPLNVRDSVVQSVESIEGNDTLERCLPTEYYAVGRFADQSLRTLRNVGFSVDETSDASVADVSDGAVMVNASTLEAITLTAQVGEATSQTLTRQLTVLDTLRTIAITPSPADVDEDETISLTASGAYVDGTISAEANEVIDKVRTITDNVQWVVISGADNASIDNVGDNKGNLTGLANGVATVQASCGSDISSELSVTINETIASDSDELSFDLDRTDNVLLLDVNETYQLAVSRGSEFDDEDEVDISSLEFSVVNTGSTSNTIDLTAIESGLVRALVAGAQVRVTAILFDDDDQVEASGSLTVRVNSL